jgi:tetratricopeptide (TPR) repeat protein
MAIQGPLRELGVHDVFQLLDLGKKTGRLRVISELRHNEGTIWFHEASVVAATIKSNPHLFGHLLLKTGRVGADDLARAQAAQGNGDRRRIGEILVSFGALSARDLAAQVRAQIEEVVFTMLNWAEGHFLFEEMPPESIPREAEVRISVEALLLEAARRIDEWSRIRSRVPHLGVIPRLAVADAAEPGTLVLTPFEWRILAAADGHRDLQSIATALGNPEFDVARAIFGLVTAGVILLRDPIKESTAAAPREDPNALLSEAERQLAAGNAEAAREITQAAAAAFPEEPRVHLMLGRILLAAGRYGEAEPALREAVRLDPGSPKGLRLLSWSLLGNGRLEEAVHGFEAWLALPSLGLEEERKVATVGAALPAARQLASLLKGKHD